MIPRPTIASHGRAVVAAIDAADAEGDPLYTATEVAATLRVADVTVRRWIEVGAVSAIVLGARTYLVRDSEVRRMTRSAQWRS